MPVSVTEVLAPPTHSGEITVVPLWRHFALAMDEAREEAADRLLEPELKQVRCNDSQPVTSLFLEPHIGTT